MLARILLLSGSISSGKSTLGKGLIETYGGAVLKTKQVIKVLKLKVADDRDSQRWTGQQEVDGSSRPLSSLSQKIRMPKPL